MDDKILQTLVKVTDKLKTDKDKKDIVVSEFKTKEKTKALTTAERLDRIERILGIK